MRRFWFPVFFLLSMTGFMYWFWVKSSGPGYAGDMTLFFAAVMAVCILAFLIFWLACFLYWKKELKEIMLKTYYFQKITDWRNTRLWEFLLLSECGFAPRVPPELEGLTGMEYSV